jgi:alanine racemase
MTQYVVVEVDDFALVGTEVVVFGPYVSSKEAEQARRIRHMDFVMEGRHRYPRTYVKPIEEGPR